MTGLVAVVGASGFVGRAVVVALDAAGWNVRAIRAPHLTQPSASLAGILGRVGGEPAVADLVERLRGCDAVVNAAGMAQPESHDWSRLAGANALLPGVIAAAAHDASVRRMVHVSSMAVQGRRRVLDARPSYDGLSPYSRSKVMGELVLLRMPPTRKPDIVILRPGSVQGLGRSTTRSLTRLAGSRLSSVAGSGERPSPQNLVQNVAAAVVHLVEAAAPPAIVLQPWEGITTGGLLRGLGGREPRHLSPTLARAVLWPVRVAGSLSARAHAWSRRLDLLWFGQAQEPGYLEHSAFKLPGAGASWAELSAKATPARPDNSHLVRTLAEANTRSDA